MQSQLQTERGALTMMGFSHQADLQGAWVDEALPREAEKPSLSYSFFPGIPQSPVRDTHPRAWEVQSVYRRLAMLL